MIKKILIRQFIKWLPIFVVSISLVQCRDHCKSYCNNFNNEYCRIILEKQSGGKIRGNWVAAWNYSNNTKDIKKKYMVFSKQFWNKLSIGDTLIKPSRDSVYYLIKSGQRTENEMYYSNSNLKCDCNKYQ